MTQEVAVQPNGWESKMSFVRNSIDIESNYRLILENHPKWKNKIRYNTMTNSAEIDKERISDRLISDIVMWITTEYTIAATSAKVHTAVAAIAEANPYSPVKDYLKANFSRWSDKLVEPSLIDKLPFLISSNFKKYDLYIKYLRKWLMAAVMRVLEPGCKFDAMLVLNGPENVGKSSFLRYLGKEWFSDSPIIYDDKDSRIALHQAWIHEDAELESATKADLSRLKAFITQREDTFRKPYARTSMTAKRSFVLAGTTNHQDFQKDPTGNRRYWVIEFDKFLNHEQFIASVDDIWGEAMHYYYGWTNTREGKPDECSESPYLETPDLFKANMENNSTFYDHDEWEDSVSTYLETHTEFTIKDILVSVFEFEEKYITKREQNRVAHILKYFGYFNRSTRCPDGKFRRFWTKRAKS